MATKIYIEDYQSGLSLSSGDTVYVLGGPGHAVSAQELAEWWGTIPYEVTCLLGKNTKN